jgi:hypothetical protein
MNEQGTIAAVLARIELLERRVVALEAHGTPQSPEWLAGFAAARHQAANLIAHRIVDEGGNEDMADKCSSAVLLMTDNGTEPFP